MSNIKVENPQKNINDSTLVIPRNAIPNKNPIYLFLKRGQDIFFSLLAIITLLPVLLLISLIIVLDDPSGSPIFCQVRCGKNGRPFRMLKFRSMRKGAEDDLKNLLVSNEMDGPVFKIKDDPRITKFGKFIRKTSLDELPQLFNILIGDMSIVGPRPALPREVDFYNTYHNQRLLVRPGLTCIWQIQPLRNSINFEDWVNLDIEYINKQSFLLDLKIIFKTISAVFKGYGE
ncbi:MAG: sugar transferase [Clostridia bacterium]|nr:sugar transferase [Clostridia bacterium]